MTGTFLVRDLVLITIRNPAYSREYIKAYFRSFNSVFGKIGNIASEEVVVKLIMMKCIPVILYGLDACPVNAM